MRISDWSSDVCSSDLLPSARTGRGFLGQFVEQRLVQKARSVHQLHSFDGENTVGVAPVTLVVHAIAEDVAVNARQANEIGFQVWTSLAVVVLVDQHGGVYGAGTGMFAEVDDGAQGVTFVEDRSEEHTSELQSLMSISYAVFCLKKKNHKK